MCRLLLVLALLLPQMATADAARPGTAVDPPNIKDFRLCRVALIYHLDTGFWEDARYPRVVAETLLEQVHFVMAEYLFGTLSDSVATSVSRSRYSEKFFFDNADIVRDRGDELGDLALREAILDRCVGVIWTTVRFEIDRLLTERRALIGLPEPAPHLGPGPQ
ncbi:MAG: hypothetical protein AAGC57_13070 [Pseudomonadota bacterium]